MGHLSRYGQARKIPVYTKYDVDGANDFGENFRKPTDQSEASIQWKIAGAQQYAIAFCIPLGGHVYQV